MSDSIPKSGYIQVEVPVHLTPSSTLSSASCKSYTCLNVTDSSVTFLISNGLSSGDSLTLQIGGATNPRSFAPTKNFYITTLDTDGVSKIDVGYNAVTAMTIAGSIVNFNVV